MVIVSVQGGALRGGNPLLRAAFRASPDWLQPVTTSNLPSQKRQVSFTEQARVRSDEFIVQMCDSFCVSIAVSLSNPIRTTSARAPKADS